MALDRHLELDYIQLLEIAVVVTIKDVITYISPMAMEILMLDTVKEGEIQFFSDYFVAEDPRYPLGQIMKLDRLVWSLAVKTLRNDKGDLQHVEIRGLLLDAVEDKAIYVLDFAGFNLKRKKKDIMTTVVESSPVTIVVTDLRGVIVYVNEKFETLTGYSREEAIGQMPSLLKSGFHTKAFYDDLWQTIRSGSIWKGIIYNKKKDGSYSWEEASILPMKGLSDRVEYYLAIKEDITERKHLEEQLNEKNQSLSDAVKMLQDTQAQMIQQEKMASVGQLAAGVAHEINNPLGFITSNMSTLSRYIVKMRHYMVSLEKLIMESDSPHRDQLLNQMIAYQNEDKLAVINSDLDSLIDDVQSGLERVRHIVQGLRNFSRVDQISDVAEYDINEGVLTTLLVANNEIKYDATVDCDLVDNIPLIRANGGQINQVILNLLLNAVQAMRESKTQGVLGRISIATSYDNDFVSLCVSDDGPGMSVETLNRLFEPFYTTKPPGLGTGLGLSICYDIVVNKHGGSFIASNNVEKGSSFIMTLPLVSKGDLV